jgi:hypothetical protein
MPCCAFADFSVGWVFNKTSTVSRDNLFNTFYALKNGFYTPKTSCTKNSDEKNENKMN